MKYMLLINSAPADKVDAANEATFEDWQAYDKAVKNAGIFVSGHSLADLTTATTVRVRPDGERTVTTDGPFAETREVLGTVGDLLLLATGRTVSDNGIEQAAAR